MFYWNFTCLLYLKKKHERTPFQNGKLSQLACEALRLKVDVFVRRNQFAIWTILIFWLHRYTEIVWVLNNTYQDLSLQEQSVCNVGLENISKSIGIARKINTFRKKNAGWQALWCPSVPAILQVKQSYDVPKFRKTNECSFGNNIG